MQQLEIILHVIVVKDSKDHYVISHIVLSNIVKTTQFVSLISIFQYVNVEMVTRDVFVKQILTIVNRIHVKIMACVQISSVDMNVNVKILDFMDQIVRLILMNVSLKIFHAVDKEHASIQKDLTSEILNFIYVIGINF